MPIRHSLAGALALDHSSATRWVELAALCAGEPWMADAVCAQTDPELFFPEKGGSTASAKRVCAGCPVKAECLLYGMDDRHGIYGGLAERERRRLARRTA